MSVYKLIPSHYVGLHHDRVLHRPPPAPSPCTAEQFDNLRLLLRTSNGKLAGLAATVRELRDQLRERDATIAELTASSTRAAGGSRVSVQNRVEVVRRAEDVVVDVTSDMQIRLKVEVIDVGPGKPPLVQVASTVVHRRPASAVAAPKTTTTTTTTPPAADKPDEDAPTDGAAAESSSATIGSRYASRTATSAPGPVRLGGLGHGLGGHAGASPLYASLMWRTRQRAKELGYRFVWSRYGKILVKKDVQSPPMYILDEADLRKMG